ncbi:MAG: transposase, partial [Gammaproteobacteria bacterium]|nr:transposase [Gammaproteobacteria bacterium]
EAAKVKVRRAIRTRTTDEGERKRLYTLLKSNRFTEDSWLRRKMRKHWKRGRNHTHNQIIVRSDNYRTFQLGGRAWVKIPGLERGKRIAIPLNTTLEPTGTLRVILRDGRVEIHYAVDVQETHDCGNAPLGVDKGYTEVLVDSDGDHHGQGLGKVLVDESDARKVKSEESAPRQAAGHRREHPERTQAAQHH